MRSISSKAWGSIGLAIFLGGGSISTDAAVVPADRQFDWSGAGVPGGIPNVQSVFTTLNSSATASQINSALQNCPSNSVVMLSAGTYNLNNNTITIRKDGVVLRGATNSAGFPTTILNGTDVQMARSSWPSGGGWTDLRPVGISSGLTEGSTAITLASTPNSDFAVGDLFMIDQLDDGVKVKKSTVTWAHRPNRSYCSVVQCTGISGNTVRFQPPLIGEYWSTAQSPQAFGWSSVYGATLKRAGLENVVVLPNGSLYNIMMGPAYGSWAKNVRTTAWPTGGGAAGCRMTYSANCTLFGSIFHDLGAVSSSAYAVYPVVVTSCAVEGNVFTNLALGMPCISAVGCSFSYNYTTGPYAYSPSGWLAEYFFPHGGHTHDTLYEGNWLEAPVYFDAIFGGNNSRNAIVRNRIIGWAPGKTGDTTPITLEASMNDTVILGNVLGENSYHSSYSQMYKIDSTCQGTVKLNNYNTVNDAVNATEALATGDVVADSYRYPSKPAWFGNRPWPAFSPTASSAGSLAYTNLPAGYRNFFGADPLGGPVNRPPTISANGNPLAGSAPLTVAFTSTGSSDPEGAALTFLWTFGDGTTSTAANPSHNYQSDGTYSATLAVSDGTNTVTSNPISVRVGNQPPTIAARATPNSGPVPLIVVFTSTGSSDPEGGTLSYSWNFGDGATATTANPTHTYSTVGTFQASLIISDGVKSSSTNLTINVSDPSAALVAAYSFDEGTGNTLNDMSGNGNAGAIQGATWVAGRFGNALSFNGTSAAVTVNDSASLDFTAGMTMEAWVRPSSVTGWRPILYKDPLTYVLQGATASATPAVPSVGGTFAGNNLLGTAALPLNTWSHVAGTYDGATLRLYINGVQVASRAQTGAIQTSTGALNIGADVPGGAFFGGLIDEVRIYNRALSAVEVQADMNNPVAGARPATPQGFKFADTQ